MSLEIQIMNHPKRMIHHSIAHSYNHALNVYVYRKLAKFKDNRPYIRDLLLDMLRNFVDRDNEYLLIIQDDVILGKNFREAIEFMVENGLSVYLVNLYNNYNMTRYETGLVHSNFKSAYFNMFRGQAHIMNRYCATQLLREDMIKKFDTRHDDGYTVSVLHDLKIPYAYANPSFINHDTSFKSTIKGHRYRTSQTFDKTRDLLKLVKEWYK